MLILLILCFPVLLNHTRYDVKSLNEYILYKHTNIILHTISQHSSIHYAKEIDYCLCQLLEVASLQSYLGGNSEPIDLVSSSSFLSRKDLVPFGASLLGVLETFKRVSADL